jgi:hypothetical protein
MIKCVRCGSEDDLEKDHIVPKSQGGIDEESNKRFLCKECHDFRHAKDNILKEIDGYLKNLGSGFNSVKFTMWIMRLGVLEALNTPEKIREHGYRSYWEIPTTHYTYWYPQIKLEKLNRQAKREREQKALSEIVKLESKVGE